MTQGHATSLFAFTATLPENWLNSCWVKNGVSIFVTDAHTVGSGCRSTRTPLLRCAVAGARDERADLGCWDNYLGQAETYTTYQVPNLTCTQHACEDTGDKASTVHKRIINHLHLKV